MFGRCPCTCCLSVWIMKQAVMFKGRPYCVLTVYFKDYCCQQKKLKSAFNVFFLLSLMLSVSKWKPNICSFWVFFLYKYFWFFFLLNAPIDFLELYRWKKLEKTKYNHLWSNGVVSSRRFCQFCQLSVFTIVIMSRNPFPQTKQK